MVRNDEKININIFLGHNAHVPELEIPSDSECGNIDTTTKWVKCKFNILFINILNAFVFLSAAKQ